VREKCCTTRLGKRLVKRDDGSVEGRKNESERHREIIRRAKRVRERAAESLRRFRARDVEEQAGAARRRRRFRRKD
jgi:hypothetical protein